MHPRNIGLICLAAAACTATVAQPRPDVLRPPVGDNLYSIVELDPHVHVLTQANVFHLQGRGNVEVIEQSNGIVLVDSGGSPAGADEVIAYIRAHSQKPVTAIVLTHWHGDHTLGVSRLLEQWPHARVISTAQTRDMLANPIADRFMPGDNAEANARYNANNTDAVAFLQHRGEDQSLPAPIREGFAAAATEYTRFAREMTVAHRTVPTETFTDHLDLPDRTTPVEIHHFGRANTEGDAIAWLPRQRIVMTGDIVVAPIPYGFNSYPHDWIDVLARIKALNFVTLVPGHGLPMHDSTYLDTISRMLASVRTQVAPLATDPAVTNDNVGARVDLGQFQTQFAHEDVWLRMWFNNYWKGPIASSALREARGQPIMQGSS